MAPRSIRTATCALAFAVNALALLVLGIFAESDDGTGARQAFPA